MGAIHAGGTYVSTTFTATSRQDILSNLDTQLVAAGWTRRAQVTGGIGKVGTFSVTIASPGVVTLNSHGFVANDVVILQTTGALPTGLSVNTRYFVRNPTTNTFELSTTSGGSSINTSGSQSGTHTLNSEFFVLESATQSNVTNPIRIYMKDGRGTGIAFSISNTAVTVGDNTCANAGWLTPGARTYRIIATKYWCSVAQDGSAGTSGFVYFGMLYVPSFVTGVSDHGFLFSTGVSDGDTTASTSRRTIRNGPDIQNQNQQGLAQMLGNGTFYRNNNTTSSGYPTILLCHPPNTSGTAGAGASTDIGRWWNDQLNMSDVLCASSINGSSDEPKIRGQFYDMVHIAFPFTIDVADTFASHDWRNMTDNYTGGSSSIRGGFWLAEN